VTRARLLNIAVFVVLLVLGVYVARHTYWTEVSVPNLPQQEAAKDEYYATKQLLARFGIRTGQIVSLRKLPPHDQVLLVPDVRDTTLEGHLQSLERWVEEGGRVILPAASIWSKGDLQSWTGIVPSTHEAPESADKKPRDPCGPHTVRVNGKPTGETLRACVRNSEFAFNSRRVPDWSLSNDYGMQMLRVAIGRGSVTVLDCECTLRNERVLKEDHARILFAATPLFRGDRFVFLDPEKAESLVAMVWRLAAPAALAVAATLALLIWRSWPRFGPLEPVAAPVRRSLAEQIRANARFAWRTRQLASLRNVMRRAVERAARKQIAAFSHLDGEQRYGALGARTGLGVDTLRAALEETADGDAQAQSAAIDLLERARRALESGNSNI
jgi:hypothetical protein